jgi:hypothetical protein
MPRRIQPARRASQIQRHRKFVEGKLTVLTVFRVFEGGGFSGRIFTNVHGDKGPTIGKSLAGEAAEVGMAQAGGCRTGKSAE